MVSPHVWTRYASYLAMYEEAAQYKEWEHLP